MTTLWLCEWPLASGGFLEVVRDGPDVIVGWVIDGDWRLVDPHLFPLALVAELGAAFAGVCQELATLGVSVCTDVEADLVQTARRNARHEAREWKD